MPSPSLFWFCPGHQHDFHSTGGRSEKRWMRAYQRAISISKVNLVQTLKIILNKIWVFWPFCPQITGRLLLYCTCTNSNHFFALPFSVFLHLIDSYIIKLFDRSVDLAQFNTSTPLYPICRAWMRNNPSVREPAAYPSPSHSMVEEEVRPYSYIGYILFKICKHHQKVQK